MKTLPRKNDTLITKVRKSSPLATKSSKASVSFESFIISKYVSSRVSRFLSLSHLGCMESPMKSNVVFRRFTWIKYRIINFLKRTSLKMKPILRYFDKTINSFWVFLSFSSSTDCELLRCRGLILLVLLLLCSCV